MDIKQPLTSTMKKKLRGRRRHAQWRRRRLHRQLSTPFPVLSSTSCHYRFQRIAYQAPCDELLELYPCFEELTVSDEFNFM